MTSPRPCANPRPARPQARRPLSTDPGLKTMPPNARRLLAALRRCTPPELAPCLMNCGMDRRRPEANLSRYPTAPSSCQRTANLDHTCR